MTGIKELKEMVSFGLTIPEAYYRAKEDGDIDISDIVHLYPIVQKAPDAIMDADEIPEELLDLTEEEYNELCNFVGEEFDIPEDRIEEAVEIGIKIGFHIALGVSKFKDIFSKDTE